MERAPGKLRKGKRVASNLESLLNGLSLNLVNRPEVVYAQGIRNKYNSNDFVEAIELAAAMLMLEPDDEEVALLLARTLDRIGDYESSIIVWNHLFEGGFTNEEAIVRLARLLYSNRRWRRCTTLCEIMIDNGWEVELALKIKARIAKMEGDDENSLVLWQKISASNPEDREADLSLDRLLFSTKRFDELLLKINRRLASNPENLNDLRFKVKVLGRLKENGEIRIVLREIVSIAPEDIDTLYTIARFAYNADDMAECIETLTKLLEIDVEHLNGLNLLARALTNEENHEESMIVRKRILSIAPEDIDNLYTIARLSYNSDEISECIDALDKLLEIDVNHTDGTNLLVRALIKKGDESKALDILNRLTGIGKLNEKMLLQHARLLYKKEQWGGAMLLFKEIYETHDSDVGADGLTSSLIRLERWQDALDILTIMWDKGRFSTTRSNRLVNMLYRMGRYDELLEFVNGLSEPYSSDHYVLKTGARALMNVGKYDIAQEWWVRLVEQDSNILEYHLGVARCSYWLNDLDLALQHVKVIIDMDSGNIEAFAIKAQICTRREEWDDALLVNKHLCHIDSEDKRHWNRRIEILYRLNRKEEAIGVFDEAIKAIPNTTNGRLVLTFIAEEYLLEERALKLATEALSITDNRSETLQELVKGYYDYGKINIAANYASLLKNEDRDAFNRSEHVNNVTNLLNLVSMSLEDFDHFGNDNTYTIELVAKAIVDKSRDSRGGINGTKKICMVSGSLRKGGAERQVAFCIRSLLSDKERNFSVDLLSHAHDEDDLDGTYYGLINDTQVSLFEFGVQRNSNILGHPNAEKLEPWIELLMHLPKTKRENISRLFYYFTEHQPDVVHAWQDETNILVGMAALMAGVPRILFSARSLSPDSKTMLHMRLRGYLRGCYRQLLSAERVVLCHNSEAGASSYRKWLEITDVNFPILHNGTDFDEIGSTTDESERRKVKAFVNQSEGALIVGSVYRFVPEKRPLLWIEVAYEILKTRKDVIFLLVGDGAMFEQCQARVEELDIGDNVRFGGKSNTVGLWLEVMDLFLLTSDVEGLPNVIIEAQGFGVPVVSTNAGGASEVIIPDVSGYIVEDDDPLAIASKVCDCLDQHSWRRNASSAALDHARKEFSVEGMYERLLKLYESIE
jgi:glycosyltransferase involved in cell wall biosynthesis/tetratricopeptide (TPR) repeat protein